MTHSSVNLTWLVYFSHPKYEDRIIFNLEIILNSLKTDIFTRLKKFFAIN